MMGLLAQSEAASAALPEGVWLTETLWIGARIHTAEAGKISACWREGGRASTTRGDEVIWGYFYADPEQVSWGCPDNPDVFVKVWSDHEGTRFVNFLHVSVPDIQVCSKNIQSETCDEDSLATQTRRYIQHRYFAHGSEAFEKDETGHSSGEAFSGEEPVGYGDIMDNDLGIGAIIITQETPGELVPAEAILRLGGHGETARGDEVVWGYFYADPSDVSWGSQENPEIFVKIWFDHGGRTDVNFFHVSVPDIEVYSDSPDICGYDQGNITTLDNRYVRHEYAPADPSDSCDNDTKELVCGNTEFALRLYQAISKDHGNFAFSPYSISQALAMTYAGARNKTAEQMAEALCFTLPQERLHPAFNALNPGADSEDETDAAEPESQENPPMLKFANALWPRMDYELRPEFEAVLSENYNSEITSLDFDTEPETSRNHINNWIREQTGEKIGELIPPNAISSDTRLVLTNAIYLSAKWHYSFDEAETSPHPFYLSDGSHLPVSMMALTRYFDYADTHGCQAISLAYEGETLSMVILLPDAGTLETFEASLTSKRMNEIFGSLQYQFTNLRMPKFKCAPDSIPLKEILIRMGMNDAFTNAADFSGMTDDHQGLFIEDVLHKAVITVDEKGTEAAASTVVIHGPGASPDSPAPKELTIDRPFLFFIRDIKTNTLIFAGRIVNPDEEF